jgi:hypothetical protein
MPFLTLEFDSAFRDYNFASLRDPGFPVRVDAADLSRMMEESKPSDPLGAGEIADVFATTLRHGTYEGFQRAHGPRPIDYGDWCLAKAGQFFGTLGVGWDPEDVLNGQPAERFGSLPWFDLIPLVRVAEREAEGHIEAILRAWRGKTAATSASSRGWGKNRERDSILVAMRNRGATGEEIVKEFDLRAIAGLPCMKNRGIVRWTEAYIDADLMLRIDQFIDKACARRKAVK